MPEENTNNNEQATNQQGANETFETWLEKQDEAVKKLYESHTVKLTNTVKATREERDALARQLKDVLPKVEKGSEAEKSLTDTLSKLEQAERRAAFAEEASKPEIGCSNPKAAYLLAQADNLFDRKGNPDWAAIKAAAPELFAKKTAKVHGGEGTGETAPTGVDMNQIILRAAGRR
jgi:small-conductance mechanosensitive channel